MPAGIVKEYLCLVNKVTSNGKYYWISQIAGWTIYSLMLSTWNYVRIGFDFSLVLQLFFIVIILGVSLSHVFRRLIVSAGWLKMRLEAIIPRIILGSLVFGVIYSLVLASILDLGYPSIEPLLTSDLANVLTLLVTWSILFLLWSTGYFAYHYLKNYEREEIKNLRLESSQREIELASLKAQLNPHFIFNAMNSIRALVDEEPHLAKSAVTKLSNILRSSLMSDRRNLISLGEELELVQDHLHLEQIRYEERLRLNYEIQEDLLDWKIPPMMIQILVENAIKHGISSFQNGGDLSICIDKKNQKLRVSVLNTGQMSTTIKGTGIGLANLRRRLNLLYNEEARFTIENETTNTVKAEIIIPKKN